MVDRNEMNQKKHLQMQKLRRLRLRQMNLHYQHLRLLQLRQQTNDTSYHHAECCSCQNLRQRLQLKLL
jgi:hypothetical protein